MSRANLDVFVGDMHTYRYCEAVFIICIFIPTFPRATEVVDLCFCHMTFSELQCTQKRSTVIYSGHSSTDRPGVNIIMSAISIKIATIGQSWALITNIKLVFEYILPFQNYSLRHF